MSGGTYVHGGISLGSGGVMSWVAVNHHAKRIYAKLGVHSKQELIDYFKRHLPER